MPATIHQWLRRYRLQTPAAILLETYRPLSFMVGQALLAASPLLPGVDPGKIERFSTAWQRGEDDPGGVKKMGISEQLWGRGEEFRATNLTNGQLTSQNSLLKPPILQKLLALCAKTTQNRREPKMPGEEGK